jgi:hypothetical protein
MPIIMLKEEELALARRDGIFFERAAEERNEMKSK